MKQLQKAQAGIIALIIVGVFILGALIVAGMYNGLVGADTNVEQKWGNVQSAYQRRADLIPSLVATVKAYSDYEGSVLEEVTKARASIGQATTPAEYAAADQQLTSALSRLLVVVEQYPAIKASENYLDLQAQLEGTENRIQAERNYYNDAVKAYKAKTRSFPTNILASMFGFDQAKWSMFQAAGGSEQAPDVRALFGNTTR